MLIVRNNFSVSCFAFAKFKLSRMQYMRILYACKIFKSVSLVTRENDCRTMNCAVNNKKINS